MSTTATLRSGDVVPLIPRSLDDQPLTPDKAVTFDLADGDYPVWIYPQRNEAYVGGAPWADRRTPTPSDVVRRYGLVERAGHDGYNVPSDASGGLWSFTLDGGVTRTVTWDAGERTVNVIDRCAGDIVGQERLEAGRRVHAG